MLAGTQLGRRPQAMYEGRASRCFTPVNERRLTDGDIAPARVPTRTYAGFVSNLEDSPDHLTSACWAISAATSIERSSFVGLLAFVSGEIAAGSVIYRDGGRLRLLPPARMWPPGVSPSWPTSSSGQASQTTLPIHIALGRIRLPPAWCLVGESSWLRVQRSYSHGGW